MAKTKKHYTLKDHMREQERKHPGFRKLVDKERKKVEKIVDKANRAMTLIPRSYGCLSMEYLSSIRKKNRIKHLQAFLRFYNEGTENGLKSTLVIDSWIALCNDCLSKKKKRRKWYAKDKEGS